MGKVFNIFRSWSLIAILVFSVLVGGIFSNFEPVFAENSFNKELCDNPDINNETKVAAGCDTDNNLRQKVNNVLNVAVGAIMFLAVLVIVFAGQRYITAQGDMTKVKQAKDMILYAVIALVVAALAWAIISFVSGAIISDANTGESSI